MRAARWTALLFLASVAALAGALLATSGPTGGEDPVHPDVGTLSPLLEPPPWRVPIAVLSNELGTILDLSLRGEKIAVLGREGWLLRGESSSVEWDRDRAPGSPNWLARPISIALGLDAVYVLDADRSVVSVWDTAGHRKKDIPLPVRTTYAQRPTQLLLGPRGSPLVTLQRVEAGGGAFWDLFALDSYEGTRRILSIPGPARSMVFSEPLLSQQDSTLFSMAPLTHRLSQLQLETGRPIHLATRADPPFWYVPLRHRREYRRMVRGLGGTAAGLSELPEFWPSVRDFTVREDGSLLVAVTAGEDRLHIELLTPGMKPVGRFSEEGFLRPLFLSQGRAFIAEERTEDTVIHELIPRTH